MTRSWKTLITLAAALTVSVTTAASQGSKKDLFTWFDTLDYPELETAKIVTVANALDVRFHFEGQPIPVTFTPALLLSDSEDTFKILSFDLERKTLTKTPNAEFVYDRIYFVESSIEEAVDYYLDRSGSQMLVDRDKLPPATKALIIARICDLRGKTQLSEKLFQTYYETSKRETPLERLRSIQSAIGKVELFHIYTKFEDIEKFSHSDILDQLLRFSERFPNTEPSLTRELIRLLREMQSEKAPLEKIACLIFQLRDQPDTFFHSSEGTPARQLTNLGISAVPQLIEAIPDPRPTRTLNGYRFATSLSLPTVKRIGDFAREILEQIAHRSFNRMDSAIALMEAEKWWLEYQEKGEKQMLIEGTAAGNRHSVRQATILLSHFPEEAAAPILTGIKKSEDANTRAALVEITERLPDDIVIPFLYKEMKAATNLSYKVAAATQLMQRGKTDTIAYVTKIWNETKFTDKIDAVYIIQFLVQSEDLDALSAIEQTLANQPSVVREIVYSTLLNSNPTHPSVSKKREELLIAALLDTEAHDQIYTDNDGTKYSSPRNCDTVGRALNYKDKIKYKFDYDETLTIRDAQRKAIINQWRKEQSLTSIEFPPQNPDFPNRIAPSYFFYHF